MELQDIISSSLRKDMKELQSFQERQKEIKEECNKNIQWIKQVVEKIKPESIPYRRSFQAVFGEEFKSFRDGFVRIMAQLEKQLDKEEIHVCDSKKCLTQLKKKFEKFFYLKPKEDFHECDGRAFQSYSGYSIQEFKDRIVRYQKGIEKGIDVRAPHEEVLQIKEIDVNERRKKERHMIELEMLKLEKMTQKGECSNTGNAQRARQLKNNGFHRAFSSLFGEDVEYFSPRLFFNVDKLEKQLNSEEFNEEIAMVNILISLMDSIKKAIAERGLYKRVHDSRVNERTMQTHEEMRSKDAPEIDNNVARASHDKDNVTKAFKQDEDKYVNNIIQLEDKNKDLENIVCKMGKSSQTLRMLTNEQSLYQDNKRKMCLGYTYPCPLGQAIACHSKLYDAEDLGLHYVKPDVHDTKEILNDAEENPSTSNVSSESIKEMSDLPISKMPNEISLSKSSKELQQELTEEVQEMLNTFDSMESKVD
ncbi:hypothetical protein Tco_1422617 [Tanacetum coccineum]